GTVVQAASGLWLHNQSAKVSQGIVTMLTRRIQRHVLDLPVAYFDRTSTAALASTILHESRAVEGLGALTLLTMIAASATAVAILPILFVLDAGLAIVASLFLTTLVAIAIASFLRARTNHRQEAATSAELAARVADQIGGIRTLKAYRAEDAERVAFE